MSMLPKDAPEPNDGGRKGPSRNRIIVWVIGAGVALYLIGSGIYGILTH